MTAPLARLTPAGLAALLLLAGLCACTIETAETAEEIPFSADFGLVFLEARVDGSAPLSFLLDTGFDVSVIDAGRAKKLGLQLGETEAVEQPGGIVETGQVLGQVRFGLGGLEVASTQVQTIPLAQLAPFVGRPVDGVLGHDVLSRLVVEIDYERQRLRLQPPDGWIYDGDGEAVPLAFDDQGQVFVQGSFLPSGAAPVPARLKLDTGSMDAVGLNRNFVEASKLFGPSNARIPVPGLAVGGQTEGYLTRIAGLSIGRHELRDLVVGVTTDSSGFEDREDAGTLGGEILGRFRVILDFARERMILEPSSRFDERFVFDRSGLWLIAEGDDFRTFRVFWLMPNGPASRAGVRAGDVVTAVDGRPASQLTLATLWQEFRREEGRVIELDVTRGVESFKIELQLRSLI